MSLQQLSQLQNEYEKIFKDFLSCLEEENAHIKSLQFNQVEEIYPKKQKLFQDYQDVLKKCLEHMGDTEKDLLFLKHKQILKNMEESIEIIQIDAKIFANIIQDLTKAYEKPKASYGPYRKIISSGQLPISTKEL